MIFPSDPTELADFVKSWQKYLIDSIESQEELFALENILDMLEVCTLYKVKVTDDWIRAHLDFIDVNRYLFRTLDISEPFRIELQLKGYIT